MHLNINQSSEIDINIDSKDLTRILSKSEQILSKLKPKLVKLAAKRSINLNFVSDEQIRALNKQFRFKDKATDVLSWGFISQNVGPEEIAGEIYISVDTAKRQAEEKGHDFNYEVAFLAVHGLLHVFDYDHQTDEEEKEMNEIALKILQK